LLLPFTFLGYHIQHGFVSGIQIPIITTILSDAPLGLSNLVFRVKEMIDFQVCNIIQTCKPRAHSLAPKRKMKVKAQIIVQITNPIILQVYNAGVKLLLKIFLNQICYPR
jgi:hypothetical protein